MTQIVHFVMNVSGQDAVTRELRNAAMQGQKRVSATTYHWAMNAIQRLRTTPYPPERPGQRYIRTYKLARSWRAEPISGGARITNDRPGVLFVVGDRDGGGQAWMHLGRWWTAEGILRNERQKLRPAIVTELNHLFSMGQIRR